MRRFLMFFILIMMGLVVRGQEPEFAWARKMDVSRGYDFNRAMTVDVDGNIIVAGTFEGLMDMDFGPESMYLNSELRVGMFASSWDPERALRWAVSWNIAFDSVSPNTIAAGPTGNVLIAGRFSKRFDADPGGGTTELEPMGYEDGFLIMLDSDGSFLWARRMGATNFDIIQGVVFDADGNVYATGFFTGTVDFDPSGNVDELVSDDAAAFVWKLDANGNHQWAKGVFSDVSAWGTKLAIDHQGNVIAAGSFEGTADF